MLCEKTLATFVAFFSYTYFLFVFLLFSRNYYDSSRRQAATWQRGLITRKKKMEWQGVGRGFEPCNITSVTTANPGPLSVRVSGLASRLASRKVVMAAATPVPCNPAKVPAYQGRPSCKTRPSVTGNPGQGKRSRDGESWVPGTTRAATS